MQERHQLFDVAMGLDQLVIDIARMRSGVADARETRNLGGGADQAPEAVFSIMVGVDVLAQQRDLARAEFDETPRLRDDGVGRPRIFRAARIRHDAEGAEFVTAFWIDRNALTPGATLVSGRKSNLASAGKSVSSTTACWREARATISGRR